MYLQVRYGTVYGTIYVSCTVFGAATVFLARASLEASPYLVRYGLYVYVGSVRFGTRYGLYRMLYSFWRRHFVLNSLI